MTQRIARHPDPHGSGCIYSLGCGRFTTAYTWYDRHRRRWIAHLDNGAEGRPAGEGAAMKTVLIQARRDFRARGIK